MNDVLYVGKTVIVGFRLTMLDRQTGQSTSVGAVDSITITAYREDTTQLAQRNLGSIPPVSYVGRGWWETPFTPDVAGEYVVKMESQVNENTDTADKISFDVYEL